MPIEIPLPISKGGTSQAATGTNSFAAGYVINSSGNESVSIGNNINTLGNSSIVIGKDSQALANQNICIGLSSTAGAGGNSIAIGTGSITYDLESIAIGTGNTAIDGTAIVIGAYNESRNDNAIAVGYENFATDQFCISIGNENTALGEKSIAFGHGNETDSDNSIAIGITNALEDQNTIAIGISNSVKNGAIVLGKNCDVDGAAISIGKNINNSGGGSTAIGDNIVSTVANSVELGYWSDDTTRVSAIRMDSTGVAALTVPDSATALTDGGTTAGSEAAGSLPRKSAAFRLSGDSLFIDYNNASGSVQTVSVAPIRGQSSRITSGTISFSGVGVYSGSIPSATFDSTTALGTTAGSSAFSIKNTSGATRVVMVSASIEVERTLSGTNDIGIKLAKNGSQINETEIQENTSSNNPAYLTTSWMVSLANNDEVALFVANLTSTDSVNFNRGRIVVSAAD